jgi:hypothetical protein
MKLCKLLKKLQSLLPRSEAELQQRWRPSRRWTCCRLPLGAKGKLSIKMAQKLASLREYFHAQGLLFCYSFHDRVPNRTLLQKGTVMLIFMFTSEARPNLHAFAGDATGSKLPENHAPWSAAGLIRSDQHPPHRFSRAKIEEAIKLVGFQLWRMKPPQQT